MEQRTMELPKLQPRWRQGLPSEPARGQKKQIEKDIMKPRLGIGEIDPTVARIYNDLVEMEDRKRVPLTHREMASFEFVTALLVKMKEMDVLKPRLQKAKLWRRYRQAVGLMDKVVVETMGHTMTDANIRHMNRVIDGYEVVVRPKITAGRKCCDQVITFDDLKVLCIAAMDARCRVCMKDHNECKRCELRNVLLNYVPLHDIDDSGLCEYATAKISEG